MEEKLEKAIKIVIQASVEEEFDEAIERLNEKKNEIVAGILLNVMKTVEIERVGERVIFTIREIKK